MCLRATAAAAGTAGGPEAPGVASPLPDLNGAVAVGVEIAGGTAAGAGVPVDLVDLPESDVEGTVGVVVGGGVVAGGLLLGNALAASLGPARVGGASLSDVHGLFADTAGAGGAGVGGAVAAAAVSNGSGGRRGQGGDDEGEGEGAHVLRWITVTNREG